MNKTLRTAAIILILMISSSVAVTAQTSPNNSPASASPAASDKELTPNQTIALLLGELKELRQLLATTKAERDAALANLDDEKKISASLERSHALAETLVATLNRSIEHLERAIALNEKTIALTEKQRDQAKADAKRSRKQALIATLAAVGLALLRH